MAEIAERVRAFVERVEAHRDVFIDRLPGIEREAAIAPGAGLHTGFVDPRAIGFLERPVEQTATGATAEGDRSRPFSISTLCAL
ncbi:MAG: hypothetical protein WDN50_15325 [Bradyrhizobium sp.]